MDIRLASWLQAWAVSLWDSPRDQRGQGTVEYIGTVVMVTLLIAGIAAAANGWGPSLGGSMKSVLTSVLKDVKDNLNP